MGRHEDFPDFEFKSFPPRKMLDYYCPKKLAEFNARKEATRERVQATIQSPVFISVNEKRTAIVVDDRLSIFDTDDFARARTVVAKGKTDITVDFMSARKLLAQLSQAPVTSSRATVVLP